MPSCDVCEYRYNCFTLPNIDRPLKVKVNWKITNYCGMCVYAKFGTAKGGYGVSKVGFCEKLSWVVHKNSAICDEKNFKPKKLSQVDKVYAELKEELNKKSRKTKLPKYCVIEEK